MHRPAAAKGDQGKVPRVEAPVQRDELEGVDHVVVGNSHDAAGGGISIHPQPGPELRHCPLDGTHVGLDLPAAEILAVDPAQPEIGIGGGGAVSALSVGCRAGNGPGRMRSDIEFPVVIHPGD